MSNFRPRQCGLFIVILSSTLSLKTVVFFYPLLFLRLLSPPSYSLIQIDITVTCEWRWLLYVKLPSSPMRLVHRQSVINALPKNSCFLLSTFIFTVTLSPVWNIVALRCAWTHFLMLLISDSALLPFSATGGGRKATSSPVIACLQNRKDLIHTVSSLFYGASDGTWTRTSWNTRPSNVPVCLFQHTRIY